MSNQTVAEKSKGRELLRRIGNWLKTNFGMKPSEAGHIALSGLFSQNPVLILLLGLCPAMAITTSLQNGVAMGLATAVVLTCSNLIISLLRSIIPGQVRLVSHLVIIATFTTAVDLLLQAFLPGLSGALGLYVPLIVVNGILLSRAEAFASQNEPGKAFLDGVFMGLGFTGALAILGAIREILGAGTIWGFPIPVISSNPVSLVLSPCGGFITLGFLIAFVQFLCRLGKGGSKA